MEESEKCFRLADSYLKLGKAIRKKEKAKAFRIWVENNPKVNILTYFYYRIKERAKIKINYRRLK